MTAAVFVPRESMMNVIPLMSGTYRITESKTSTVFETFHAINLLNFGGSRWRRRAFRLNPQVGEAGESI